MPAFSKPALFDPRQRMAARRRGGIEIVPEGCF